jgi:hypothetical protein
MTGKTVVNEGMRRNVGRRRGRIGSAAAAAAGRDLIDFSPNDIAVGSDIAIANLREMIAVACINKLSRSSAPWSRSSATTMAEPFILELNARFSPSARTKASSAPTTTRRSPTTLASPRRRILLLDEDGHRTPAVRDRRDLARAVDAVVLTSRPADLPTAHRPPEPPRQRMSIPITTTLRAEISFDFHRASGPGGRTSTGPTAVRLRFNVRDSRASPVVLPAALATGRTAEEFS